jgi:hypothetical protein
MNRRCQVTGYEHTNLMFGDGSVKPSEDKKCTSRDEFPRRPLLKLSNKS